VDEADRGRKPLIRFIRLFEGPLAAGVMEVIW